MEITGMNPDSLLAVSFSLSIEDRALRVPRWRDLVSCHILVKVDWTTGPENQKRNSRSLIAFDNFIA